jgi:hypothetical protein
MSKGKVMLLALFGLLLAWTVGTFNPAGATIVHGCADTHVASGTESLDHWVRVHHHSVSEVITASLACHEGVWPRGLARYMDAGFLHRAMPEGMRFYTVAGS